MRLFDKTQFDAMKETLNGNSSITSWQIKGADNDIYCVDMTINGNWVRVYRKCNGNINAMLNVKVDTFHQMLLFVRGAH